MKRIEIQNGIGRTTIMIWGHEPSQGWGLLEERGPNGELFARHVHGPNVDDLVLSELSGAVYYYHQDHLNSTVAVTDENGNVVEQYRYDAYGQPSFYDPDGTPRTESALGLRFLFTGREWLASLALYDYRHRAYSPSLGRFLQMDPLGFGAGDVNVYRYVRNVIILDADPWGLCRAKRHCKKAVQAARWTFRKAWNLPNTAIGLAHGTAGFLIGLLPGVPNVRVSVGHNAIQFENNPLCLAGTALTIGNVISYGVESGPEETVEEGSVGQHEEAHTYQGEQLGPLYLPVYLVSGVGAVLRGANPFGRENFMERGPYMAPPRPWPWDPVE